MDCVGALPIEMAVAVCACDIPDMNGEDDPPFAARAFVDDAWRQRFAEPPGMAGRTMFNVPGPKTNGRPSHD